MARLPRLALGGHLHLLLQRGRSGHSVFITPQDAQSYLYALRTAADQFGVAVHAYSLSAGDALLLVTPATADALSRMVQSVGRRFVGDYNQRHGGSGSPWEGRFRSTVIDPAHCLLSCLCFVETFGSGVATAAENSWSSAPHHMGQQPDPLITEHSGFWHLGNTPFEREVAHRQLLARGLSPPQALRIREALLKGWALGEASFVASLGKDTKRRTGPLRRGRPIGTSRVRAD